ncbi:MAG: hypothetical protein ABJB97_12390, partial [Acidobacteriota bacterium]
MAREELKQEAVWVIRLLKSNRESLFVKDPVTMLIHMHPIRTAETKPATRKDSHARQEVDRVVGKCILCAAANILNGLRFKDWLEVLVHREVDANTGKNLIRSVQQHYVSAAEGFGLRVAVYDVPNGILKSENFLGL